MQQQCSGDRSRRSNTQRSNLRWRIDRRRLLSRRFLRSSRRYCSRIQVLLARSVKPRKASDEMVETSRLSCVALSMASFEECSTDRRRPTSNFQAPVVVLDLSAVYASEALGAVIVCASAALEATSARGRCHPAHDPCYRRGLGGIGQHRRLQFLRFPGNSHGRMVLPTSRWYIAFPISHPLAVPGRWPVALRKACSRTVRRWFVMHKHGPEMERHGDWGRGLGESEARLLPRLRRPIALWKVARRSYLVEHRLARNERVADRHRHQARRLIRDGANSADRRGDWALDRRPLGRKGRPSRWGFIPLGKRTRSAHELADGLTPTPFRERLKSIRHRSVSLWRRVGPRTRESGGQDSRRGRRGARRSVRSGQADHCIDGDGTRLQLLQEGQVEVIHLVVELVEL